MHDGGKVQCALLSSAAPLIIRAWATKLKKNAKGKGVVRGRKFASKDNLPIPSGILEGK